MQLKFFYESSVPVCQQHNFKICTLAALALSGLLIANAGFSKPPPGTPLAQEQVLRRGNGSEPGTLDPHKSKGIPASRIQRDLYDGLVLEAADGSLIPGVATHWEISEDGLRYTFHLRKSLWSNGDPVTAEDFVVGMRRTVDPATGSDYATTLASIRNAPEITAGKLPSTTLGVKALDDYTLEIELAGPTPYFLGLLTHSTTYPIHRASYEQFGDKFTRPSNLVGNGAYKLTEWVVNSHIKLERNHLYWDDENTTINTVFYYPTEDTDSEVLRYRAGEIDFTNYEVPSSAIPTLRESIPDELYITPWFGNYYVGMNVTRPPFKDNIKLRKALTMAIDREILTDKVLRDGVIPAYGFVPPGTLNYTSFEYDWKDWPREKRLAEARRLYEEAGYSKDNPLRIEYRYNTNENHKKIALAVTTMWRKNLGVYSSIINQEWKVFLDVRVSRRVTESYRDAWIGDYNDPYTFLELGISTNRLNYSGFNNPRYDELLRLSGQEYNVEKRRKLLQDAEAIMMEEYVAAPIYYYVSKRLIKPYVKGYVNNVLDHHHTKDMYILQH